MYSDEFIVVAENDKNMPVEKTLYQGYLVLLSIYIIPVYHRAGLACYCPDGMDQSKRRSST